MDKTTLLGLLLTPLLAQVQLTQVPRQIDGSFFRKCLPNGAYVTYATPQVTKLNIRQIANYGVRVENDGKTLRIGESMLLTTTSQSGTIDIRFAMNTPNIDLSGLLYNDLKITGGSGYGLTVNAYTSLPLVRVSLVNGKFVIGPVAKHSTSCEAFQLPLVQVVPLR